MTSIVRRLTMATKSFLTFGGRLLDIEACLLDQSGAARRSCKVPFGSCHEPCIFRQSVYARRGVNDESNI